jgi:hypothetical protein
MLLEMFEVFLQFMLVLFLIRGNQLFVLFQGILSPKKNTINILYNMVQNYTEGDHTSWKSP